MPEPILVVDDQRELRLLIRLSLLGLGRVETADGTAQAFAQIRAERPRLIVLDVSLGSDSGLDFCRALKSDPATAAIPVILLSAHGQQADMAAGASAGAERYLVKPFSPRALLEVAAELLDPA